eukprot:732370-Pyramimonas_sp.AAC.1
MALLSASTRRVMRMTSFAMTSLSPLPACSAARASVLAFFTSGGPPAGGGVCSQAGASTSAIYSKYASSDGTAHRSWWHHFSGKMATEVDAEIAQVGSSIVA